MAKSLLCKSCVGFLMVLAENDRYLTYSEIVDFHFAKEKKSRQIDNELAEKRKIYDAFRDAKRKLEEIQDLTGRKYFIEGKSSKTFKIHKEVIEKPRTCVILLELIFALREGIREVRRGEFERAISAKYRNLEGGQVWSENFVRARLKDACQSKHISFNEERNEYEAEVRLTSDLGLITGIVRSYLNADKTDNEIKSKLQKLLEIF